MHRLVSFFILLPAALEAQGWGSVGQPTEAVFSWGKWWTEPIFDGFWMAWTRATLAFFVFLFAFIAAMAVIEIRRPGGDERAGIFGLTTTRGDRLFIGLLGSAYIFLAWFAIFGTTILIALLLAVVWVIFCFWKV